MKPSKPDKQIKTDKIIHQKYTAAFMSNAKWVKLITVLIENHNLIENCRVKLVWDDAVRTLQLDENTSFGFDFYEKSMEAMVSNCPQGWCDYKEIECLELSGDVAGIEAVLLNIGKFEYEKNKNSLRLYGYK